MEKEISTRDTYGKEIIELGKKNKDIIVLDADLSVTTRTNLFKNEFPDRFIDLGIAEQNLLGVSAGLAAAGKIPFASTFAMYAAGRAFEQVRNSVCYPNLNVKIVTTHGGLTAGQNGAGHQCLEDIGLMRIIPNMVVISPSDSVETKKALKAIENYNGPVYLRLSVLPVPIIHDEDTYEFEIGKGNILVEGDDLTVIATGSLVANTLEAVKRLNNEGYSVELINMPTIKPLDIDLINESVSKTGEVVTVEEHNVIGGLGGAVSEELSSINPVKVNRIGIKDQFGISGYPRELLKKFNLDADGIYNQLKDILDNKKEVAS